MKKPIKILTKSAEETKKIGERLAKTIQNVRSSVSNNAIVISLEGELGAGKTTFAQGFARGLGIKENPRSPTFVIMRIYPVRNRARASRPKGRGRAISNGASFIHIDAYRIISRDLKTLGWRDLVKNKANIILIEWGNRISRILPRGAIKVKLKHGGLAHERALEISNF